MQERIFSMAARLGASTDNGKREGEPFFSIHNIITLALIVGLALYPGWSGTIRLLLVVALLVIVVTGLISSYAGFVCRCILPLLIGGICVEAYILLWRWDSAGEITRYFVFKQDYSQNFYTGVATLYAIITALALVKGIEDFDAMKRNISEEAHKVRTISEMTHYFDIENDPAMREAVLGLRRKLLRYARNVLALRDQTIKGENLELLRDCRTDIAKLKPADENDQYSLQFIVEAHSELGTLRSQRIGAIGEKIPFYLIAALWLTALGLILPFMAEPLQISAQGSAAVIPNEARFGQYYIIFLMGALNSFLLLMLSDISDPFDGFWQVNFDPFDELRLELADQMDAPDRPASQTA